MKKIDVIIPAYKAQESIIKTISSCACQSIIDQIIVTIVNDADEIGYEKIVNNFKDYLEIREIKLDKNGGPGVARQFGIDNTSCPYFTCIDADDTFAGAFSLELLLHKMEEEPGFHTVVGGFAEEHKSLNFVPHSSDMVWMFGKLYTRSFIEKYKIRFNETRANEDTGFNTIIRLVSSDQERIKFISDIVYFWHFKEDSITRINNGQYSYDQSFVGYTDNMIYAINHARKVKPFNSNIDVWAIHVMAQLYIYYYQTVVRDSRFIEQNYSYCLKYYKEVFEHYHKTMEKEVFVPLFAEVFSTRASDMGDTIPELTIFQFIDQLNKDCK